MNWSKLFMKLGILPIKHNEKEDKICPDFLSTKFILWVVLRLLLCAPSLCSYVAFIYTDNLRAKEIIKVFIFVSVNLGDIIFQVVVAIAAAEIGPRALDFYYKVVVFCIARFWIANLSINFIFLLI